MKHRLLWIFASMVMICSCSSESDKEHSDVGNDARITMILSISGQGDNGYNDLITQGLMRFYNSSGVILSMQHPHSMNEAKEMLNRWIDTPSDSQELLVLSADYAELAGSEIHSLADNKKVLLFEAKDNDKLPKGVSTFYIQRYGASYLSGCIASPHWEATIMAAMPGEQPLEDAIQGFADGYAKGGNKAKVFYLANDVSGYAMADSAYRYASRLDDHFVFPLAGGSNSGIYKSSRESLFSTMLVVGMDVDCGAYSGRIPYSMVVHIDRIVEDYLTEWLQTGSMRRHQTYGLDSGMIEVVLSKYFADFSYIWEDYYRDYYYWENALKQYTDEAKEKEKAYENK